LCNLGEKAAKKFTSLGYPVKEMVGGFEEWKRHKLPIEK
jgi:rhodanese-related sulfurtransferase